MKNALTTISICLLVLIASSTSGFAKPDRPNVVILMADNLGYGDVSSYNGNTRGNFKTPRIDTLVS